MELVADGLFILAGFGAAFYCLILSRRIRRLSNLDSGLGAAIAGLSTQVEEMRRTLDSARSISGKTQKELTQMTARAEIAAGRLELLLVAVLVHDIGKANAGFLSRQKKSTRKKGHKALGKELVESPMQELELTSPEMAQDLRVVLKDVLGTSRTSATKAGRLLHGLDHDFSFKDASSESLKGTAPNAKWGHLKGKPGPGRSYYRVRHLTVVK